MWGSIFSNIDRITGSAFAAVLCTLSVQRLASRQSRLYSEILSWIILPILFRVARRPVENAEEIPITTEARPSNSRSLWIVATCLVISCWCQTEVGMIPVLVSKALDLDALIWDWQESDVSNPGPAVDPKAFQPGSSCFKPNLLLAVYHSYMDHYLNCIVLHPHSVWRELRLFASEHCSVGSVHRLPRVHT